MGRRLALPVVGVCSDPYLEGNMDLLVDMEVQCTLASNMVGNNSMADLHTEAGTVEGTVATLDMAKVNLCTSNKARRKVVWVVLA